MARIDEDPEERDQTLLLLDAIITCPGCGGSFDFVFQAPEGVYEREDLVDEIETRSECPICGMEFPARYEGWTSHEDA